MSFEIVQRGSLAPGEWDALVRGSPDGWTFALYGWQELILAVAQWGLEDFSFALREGSKLIAVVPLQFNAGTGRMSSSGWGGCGPIVSGTLAGKMRHHVMQTAMDQCYALARERGASHFDLSISPVTQTSIDSAWGVNPLVFHGLEDRSGLSQVIDLELSEEELWAALSPDARRQIRMAREKGCVAGRVDWQEHLDRYYSIHDVTYRRTGVQPHPKAYFAGIAAHTAPTGNSVLWAALAPNGEAIAYHNAAWLNSGGSYHTGCSLDEAGKSGASYLLFWEAIIGAKAAGLRWYDCGPIFPGSSSPKQKGLSTFKTKFGGQPHRFFAGEKPLADQGMNRPQPEYSANPKRVRWPEFVRRILPRSHSA